jgi:LuxR family maltose regulon positive regulatory protein
LIFCAPGYGATTAAQQALLGSADELRWVGVDSGVSDEQASRLVRAAVDAPGSDVNGLMRGLKGLGSAWLVVDGLCPDIHPRVTADLVELAGQLPASSRLLVISTTEFDLPGALVLAEDVLAFEPDEAFDLIRLLDPNPTMDDAVELIGVADGWANALIAGAQLLRTRGASQWLGDTAAQELLMSWWQQLPDDQRDLFSRTAVLDDLNAGPVELITGDPAAADRLLTLHRQHRFVRSCEPPRGHTGHWWRRHPLLTALLRQRVDADAVRAHSAAAEWYRQAGDVHATITHLIEAGRPEEAGRLLMDHESVWLSTGEARTVLTWYDKIAEAQDHRIESLLRIGWGQAMARDIVGADTTVAQLRSEIDSQTALRHAGGGEGGDTWVRWDAEEALLRAYLAPYHGDPATAIASGRRAMGGPGPRQWRDADQLAPVLVARGLMWSGDSDGAEKLVASIPAGAYSNDVIRELHLAGVRALALCANGKIVAAAAVLEKMRQWIDGGGVDPVSIQMYAPGLAQIWVDVASGRLSAASDRCNDLLPQAQEVGHICDATWLYILTARIDLARGDYGAAVRSLGRGRDLALSQTADSRLTVPLDQCQALVYIAAGDVVRAERLVHALPASPTRSLLAARAGLMRQPVLTRRTLDAVPPTTPRVAAERQLLLAAVHGKQNRRIAQGHLQEAATIAAEHGMRQLLAPPVRSVLELAQETALEFNDQNLKWLLGDGDSLPEVPDGTDAWNLSRGELQLLAILPGRAKNIEIADLLGVSVNTVKTRLRRLYAKLGAANRDEAIERARERGLLVEFES